MLSPMMTVFVLAVLWLIVVVPMLLRRNDEMRREKSVAGFGRAMRALGRRAQVADARPDVFVPSDHRPVVAPVSAVIPVTPERRPVPAPQEALMYPVDRSEMSDARVQMMKRRRRSLVILSGGTVVFTLLGLVLGGLTWLLAGVFVLSLAGYLYFLRSQALRDQDRRLSRQQRFGEPVSAGYDVTEEPERLVATPGTAVRIDDDDLDLHSMDTVDLTGMYVEDEPDRTAQRRAS